MGSVTVSLLISPNESKIQQPKLLVKLKLSLFLCTTKPEWWLSLPKENSSEHRGCDFFYSSKPQKLGVSNGWGISKGYTEADSSLRLLSRTFCGFHGGVGQGLVRICSKSDSRRKKFKFYSKQNQTYFDLVMRWFLIVRWSQASLSASRADSSCVVRRGTEEESRELECGHPSGGALHSPGSMR